MILYHQIRLKIYLFEKTYKVPVIPPEIAAYMAATAEHIFPLLLWAGLATRLSATALLMMTLVIQIFVYPNAYVTHGLWAIGLLYLMKYGPGRLSLDHLISKSVKAAD
jgi:putative oxidoreductase